MRLSRGIRNIPPAFFFACVLVPAFFSAAVRMDAQSSQLLAEQRPAGGHRGKINALVRDDSSRVISAGEDGFIGIWNIRESRAEERFQISEYALRSMALRPNRNEVAVIESDGMGLYRVSAWDYILKRHIFTLRFSDPVLFISYSAAGSFLIVSRSAQSAIVFVQSETGELLQSPQDLIGAVSFAATGRSERTMITYSPLGSLSYWELETGNEIRHFSVPANLSSPVLFGNNSFLAALEKQELVILDAVSGNEIFREKRINHLALFPSRTEDREFLSLSRNGTTTELLLYSISNAGGLEIPERRVIPGNVPVNVVLGGVSFYTAILGASDGRVYFLPARGNPLPADTASQLVVQEGAASNKVLAFTTAGGLSGFIPLDFSGFSAGFSIRLNKEAFTRITALPAASADTAGTFLYWHDSNLRSIPVLRTISPEYREQSQTPLRHLSARSPVRSVSILGNHALFLDSTGNVRVISVNSETVEFSFASAGSLDAAFLDERNIILARSAAGGLSGGNSPFLMVNIVTGETVPFPYPASVGVRVFRGGSGRVYGTVITGSGENVKTGILLLNTGDSADSVSVVEYAGEDSDFSLAEEGDMIASTLGGDTATLYVPSGRAEEGVIPAANAAPLYKNEDLIRFERGPGLPKRILSGGGFFVTIDSEGNIAWHDGKSGDLAALLRIYQDGWVLEKRDGTVINGPVLNAN